MSVGHSLKVLPVSKMRVLFGRRSVRMLISVPEFISADLNLTYIYLLSCPSGFQVVSLQTAASFVVANGVFAKGKISSSR